MNNWLHQRLVMVALLACTAFATEQTDEINAKLDSIDRAQTGVSFSGEMFSRGLSAEKYGSALNTADPSIENLFFTQMDLTLRGRPSRETQATMVFRLHQDWNNYYDEGVNPFNTRWMSYDGKIKIFDNDFTFNLGDFRFKKSPLVAYVPELTGLEYESEIFTRKREEAATDRFQGDNLRHLQGVNATYSLATGKGNRFDMTATGSQLRFPWWSNGILQYDNDDAAKYLAHVDGELTIKNLIKGGASFTSVFDVVSATRSHNRFNSTTLALVDSLAAPVYEDNFVMSMFAGFDYNEMAPQSHIVLNGRVDLAVSTYVMRGDSLASPQFEINVSEDNGTTVDKDTIPASSDRNKWILKKEPEVDLSDGIAVLAELELGYQKENDAYLVNVWGISNNAEFVSDLAQSQGMMPRSILNTANRKGLYATSNYSSMFDALYNYAFVVSPVTERNTLETDSPAEPAERAVGYNGTNNYYRAAYQKNSYTNITSSRSERQEAPALAYFQDVLPGGKASANRVGGQAELSIDALDNLLSVDAHYGMFENLESSQLGGSGISSAEYNRMGAGLVVRLGGVLNYRDGVELSGGMGYDEAALELLNGPSSSNRNTTFLSGGLKVGFLDSYEFIGGLQMLDHELWNYSGLGGRASVTESLYAAGLSAQLATGTYLSGEVSLLEGESTDVSYSQVISQLNLRMMF